MTFDVYWTNLVKKNPGLADFETKMTITVAAFKKAVEQAFRTGMEEQRRTSDFVDKLFGGDLFKGGCK